MKILVTGSNGQLGSSLRETLSPNEFDTLFLDRNSLDITNQQSTQTQISAFRPDWIINCAAWTNVDQAELQPDQCRQINLVGVHNLQRAAAMCGSRIIQISTDYVFDGKSSKPWDEFAQQNAISTYGKTKADAEILLMEMYQDHTVIVRTSWLFSAYRRNFVKTMIKLGRSENRKIQVVSDQTGQPTSCLGLSKLISEVVRTNTVGKILHGTNSGEATWFEFAQEIFSQIGLDPDRIEPVLSRDYPQVAARPTYSVLGNRGLAECNLNMLPHWKEALTAEIAEIDAAVRREG